MKITTIYILLLLCTASYGQYKRPYFVHDLHKAKLTLNTDEIVRGDLFEAGDSSIILSLTMTKTSYMYKNYTLNEYTIDQIKNISIKKENQALKMGLKVGGISAAALGGLTLIAMTQNPESGSPLMYGLVSATAGFLAGGAIGLGIGTISFKIPIHGDQNKYHQKHKRIKSKSIKK